MRTLFKVLVLLGFFASIPLQASEKQSLDFFRSYNAKFEELKREEVALSKNINTKSRGPASVVSNFKVSGLKSFFKESWSKYSSLSSESRRSVIKAFIFKGKIHNLDKMINFINENKVEMSQDGRIKAARIRGQYDALLMWN